MTEIAYQEYSDQQPLQQTSEQILIMQQSAQIVQMQALIMQYGKDIATFKGGQK